MGIKGKRKRLEKRKRSEEEANIEIPADADFPKLKKNELDALEDAQAMAKYRIDDESKPSAKKKNIKQKGKVRSMQSKLSREKTARKKQFYRNSWSSR